MFLASDQAANITGTRLIVDGGCSAQHMPLDTDVECPLAYRPRYRWELLALLCCAFFFHQGDRAIFGVVLSAIKTDLEATDGQLGLVGSVLFFTLALMMPVAGYLGDVWNRKKIIVSSLMFWSAATMWTGMAGGLAG